MSARELLIDHPGDGEWIMREAGGPGALYNPMLDHSVAVHRDHILGGVAFTNYTGGSCCLHMASTEEPNWATPTFLWAVFDHAFNHLGCNVVIGLVDAHNVRALLVDLKLGFSLVHKIPEGTAEGHDILLLQMRRRACKWLKFMPRYYRGNYSSRVEDLRDGR